MKSYCFVDGEYSVRQEIKKSVFIATVKGEVDAQGAEDFVKAIRKKYPDATHNCYAYISDEQGNATRFSDDGEPGGTAGQPILEVLRKQGIVKTAIVVTRYFGGIKLGAGGLVGAYSASAAEAVKSARIAKKTECVAVELSADYPTFATLEKYLRSDGLLIDGIEYGDGVMAKILVPTDGVSAFLADVCEASAGKAVAKTLDGTYFAKLK